MEKKKILFVITKGNLGGAQRYVYDLATNLPKDKFEAVVVCGQGDLLIEKLQEAQIKTLKLEGSDREINFKKDWAVFKDLIKTIKAEKPDIVHLNSSKIGLLGSFSVLYFKILNLFRISNLEFRALFTSHGWAFNEKHRRLVEKLIFYVGHYLTVLLCDQTIAVSEKTKKDIAWMPFIKDKTKVIYNGIAPFKKFTRHTALETLKKENNQVVVFSISELHPNKGLDVALRGLALLPPNIKEKIQYYIAGDGEAKGNLQKLARDLNIQKQVHFLGFIDNARRLLSGTDIFIFPSRTENLPFAVLEAGLSSVPIIATSVGGIPEIIKDMQNGILVHKNNPKEIAEALIYMLEHPDKAKEFKAEIKKTVESFFTIENMLSETIKLYQN